MKSGKVGVAAILTVLAVGGFVLPALAQCFPPVLIKFDAETYAYESAYNNATLMSAPGSNLTVVGKIVCFGPPLDYLNANMPATQYTFMWTLKSLPPGTVQTIPNKVWDTDYASGSQLGTLSVYEDAATPVPNPPNANPPAGGVPGDFTDGTLILSGKISYFHTQITRSNLNTYGGSFNALYYFDGGTLGNLFALGSGNSQNMNGLWCSLGAAQGQCTLPAGYSAHPSGKNDVPTSVGHSTWGMIKQLYR